MEQNSLVNERALYLMFVARYRFVVRTCSIVRTCIVLMYMWLRHRAPTFITGLYYSSDCVLAWNYGRGGSYFDPGAVPGSLLQV